MELSAQVASALRVLGDPTLVDEKRWKAVVEEVASGRAGGGGRIMDDACVRGHAALATLFAEAVRANHSSTLVTATLEDLSWDHERIAEAVRGLDGCRGATRAQLASTATFPPHIVDVDWTLNYQVRSSVGEEGGGASYLITLHTEGGVEGGEAKVTFRCSLAQLAHLVTQLRQAHRCIQKYAGTS